MDPNPHLLELVASVARELAAGPDLPQTLRRVAELAAGHDGRSLRASVVLLHRGQLAGPPVATDEATAWADARQAELGEGPWRDAVAAHRPQQVDDLVRDRRYPSWAPEVVAAGLRSVAAFPLFTRDAEVGALSLYATEPAALDPQDLQEGQAYAAQAAVAVRAAQVTEQLRTALLTRTVIGQAQGILMERYHLTAAQAFEVLRRTSQDRNRRLHDVARAVAETGDTTVLALGAPGRSTLAGGRGHASHPAR